MERLTRNSGVESQPPGIDITGLSGFYRQPSTDQSGWGVSPVASPLFGDSTSTFFPARFPHRFPFPFLLPSSSSAFPLYPLLSPSDVFVISYTTSFTMSAPAAFSDIAKAANDVCCPHHLRNLLPWKTASREGIFVLILCTTAPEQGLLPQQRR